MPVVRPTLLTGRLPREKGRPGRRACPGRPASWRRIRPPSRARPTAVDEVGALLLQPDKLRRSRPCRRVLTAVDAPGRRMALPGLPRFSLARTWLLERIRTESSSRPRTNQPIEPAVILKWPIDLPIFSGVFFFCVQGIAARLSRNTDVVDVDFSLCLPLDRFDLRAVLQPSLLDTDGQHELILPSSGVGHPQAHGWWGGRQPRLSGRLAARKTSGRATSPMARSPIAVVSLSNPEPNRAPWPFSRQSQFANTARRRPHGIWESVWGRGYCPTFRLRPRLNVQGQEPSASLTLSQPVLMSSESILDSTTALSWQTTHVS